MFEVVNAGWLSKIDALEKGTLLAEILETEGNRRNLGIESEELEDIRSRLLEPSYQLQRSVRIALVFNSLSEALKLR